MINGGKNDDIWAQTYIYNFNAWICGRAATMLAISTRKEAREIAGTWCPNPYFHPNKGKF